jgi:hypothetical protein
MVPESLGISRTLALSYETAVPCGLMAYSIELEADSAEVRLELTRGRGPSMIMTEEEREAFRVRAGPPARVSMSPLVMGASESAGNRATSQGSAGGLAVTARPAWK